MKKVLFVLALSFTILSANAESFEKIPYENIKENSKITCHDGAWTQKNIKKNEIFYTKKVSSGTASFSEFYSPDGEFVFSTGTQYEFIKNNRLIGYSNSDLKFFEYSLDNGLLTQKELSIEDIQELFKDFRIIKISEFSNSTNSLRISKTKKHCKIILLNDTDRYFYHYSFTSNNARFKNYYLRGLLDITGKGMIQFSHFGDNTKENPWYILLVR